MNFYKINNVFDKSITGVDGFQTSKMFGKYDYEAENSVWNFTKQFPLITPKLSPFLLEKGVKLLDRISTNQINSNFALVISDRLYNFLLKFKVGDFFAQKVLLTYDGNSLNEDYFLYIDKENKYDFIDFANSSFKVVSAIKKIDLDIKIDNENILTNTIEILHDEAWHKKVSAQKLILKDNFNFDLFRLGVFGGLYVSEKLKNAIEKNGFTGMEFKLMNHILKKNEFNF